MYGIGFGYGAIGSTTKLSSGVAYDSDALSYFTSASITDLTQKNVINDCVLSLKSGGYWSGIKALYPFLGGNATAHSFNLKNTAQYQMTWYSGVTHDSTGVTFNGTSGYGDTGIVPSSVLSLDSSLLAVKFADWITTAECPYAPIGENINEWVDLSKEGITIIINSKELFQEFLKQRKP